MTGQPEIRSAMVRRQRKSQKQMKYYHPEGAKPGEDNWVKMKRLTKNDCPLIPDSHQGGKQIIL